MLMFQKESHIYLERLAIPNITWLFNSAVRGYHFYQKYWTPYLSQKLDCYHDYGNDGKKQRKNVGHLPQEISMPTKFMLAKGAVKHAEISSGKYRHSPLAQGVLGLSRKVFVSMPPTVLNESRYKSLVASLFVEPPKEAEVGSSEREEHQTDVLIKSTKIGVQTKLRRKSQHSLPGEAKPDKKELPQSRDIRLFFVFKGTKRSIRDRDEKTAKFVIDLSD